MGVKYCYLVVVLILISSCAVPAELRASPEPIYIEAEEQSDVNTIDSQPSNTPIPKPEPIVAPVPNLDENSEYIGDISTTNPVPIPTSAPSPDLIEPPASGTPNVVQS